MQTRAPAGPVHIAPVLLTVSQELPHPPQFISLSVDSQPSVLAPVVLHLLPQPPQLSTLLGVSQPELAIPQWMNAPTHIQAQAPPEQAGVAFTVEQVLPQKPQWVIEVAGFAHSPLQHIVSPPVQ